MAKFNKKRTDFNVLTAEDVRHTGNILYLLLSDNEAEKLNNDLKEINKSKAVDSPDWQDFAGYCLDNAEIIYLPDKDKPEFFGQLIDTIEDWLESKGITPADIKNPERDNDETSAIIYGEDYDFLADKFSQILGISRD